MILRILLASVLALGTLSCGVKSDLAVPPGAQQPQKGTPDPSKPPKPIGT